MSEFLNRKKVRLSLIHYFKMISKCQKQIQSIQQQLIIHPRFNPLILYKKISSGQKILNSNDLKQYFRKKIGITRQQGIRMYFIKYGLQQLNFNEQITVQMFLQTLLPYTPNCLRDFNDIVLRQLETEHVDMTVQSIYHKLITITAQSLYFIRLLQRQIGLISWQKTQIFMVQDIVQNGKKIDLTIKQTTDVIYVRKWMELWVNVDEYQVLNLMRFFNGGKQHNIKKIFDNGVKIHMKCNCRERGSTYSKKPSNTLNQDYFSSEQSRKSKPKIRFHTQTQAQQKNEDQSSTSNQRKIKINQMPLCQVRQVSTFQLKQNISSPIQSKQIIHIFLLYITTLLQSQKFIDYHRSMLQPYMKQVEEILHDMLSKKKNWTKCQKILVYIGRFLSIKKQRFQRLIQQMGNAKIQSRTVFSLFNSQSKDKKVNDKKDRKKTMTPNQIMQMISYIIHKFIHTRNKLMLLSSQLVQGSCEQIVTKILIKSCSQKKQKKILKVKIQDLRQFLLSYTQKSINKKYLTLLMNHLGDGNQITVKSLIKMFDRQVQKIKSSRFKRLQIQ